jgi:hypothetical protein
MHSEADDKDCTQRCQERDALLRFVKWRQEPEHAGKQKKQCVACGKRKPEGCAWQRKDFVPCGRKFREGMAKERACLPDQSAKKDET